MSFKLIESFYTIMVAYKVKHNKTVSDDSLIREECKIDFNVKVHRDD